MSKEEKIRPPMGWKICPNCNEYIHPPGNDCFCKDKYSRKKADKDLKKRQFKL